MTKEQLKRAKEIEKMIELITIQIKCWKGATSLYRVQFYIGGNDINTNWINFPVLKSLTVSILESKLSDYEKELEAL